MRNPAENPAENNRELSSAMNSKYAYDDDDELPALLTHEDDFDPRVVSMGGAARGRRTSMQFGDYDVVGVEDWELEAMSDYKASDSPAPASLTTKDGPKYWSEMGTEEKVKVEIVYNKVATSVLYNCKQVDEKEIYETPRSERAVYAPTIIERFGKPV